LESSRSADGLIIVDGIETARFRSRGALLDLRDIPPPGSAASAPLPIARLSTPPRGLVSSLTLAGHLGNYADADNGAFFVRAIKPNVPAASPL
jgi:hypothetical protein